MVCTKDPQHRPEVLPREKPQGATKQASAMASLPRRAEGLDFYLSIFFDYRSRASASSSRQKPARREGSPQRGLGRPLGQAAGGGQPDGSRAAPAPSTYPRGSRAQQGGLAEPGPRWEMAAAPRLPPGRQVGSSAGPAPPLPPPRRDGPLPGTPAQRRRPRRAASPGDPRCLPGKGKRAG